MREGACRSPPFFCGLRGSVEGFAPWNPTKNFLKKVFGFQKLRIAENFVFGKSKGDGIVAVLRGSERSPILFALININKL